MLGYGCCDQDFNDNYQGQILSFVFLDFYLNLSSFYSIRGKGRVSDSGKEQEQIKKGDITDEVYGLLDVDSSSLGVEYRESSLVTLPWERR